MKQVAIKHIINTFKQTGNVSQTAKMLGIGRMTVYRWLKRGKTFSGGYTYRKIHRESTRPKILHYKLSSSDRMQITTLYQTRHVGAKKIKYLLHLSVGSMTIHRFLKKKNLIPKQTSYRRPLFQNGHAMRPSNTTKLGYLQMDTKHVTPELSGLPFTVYEYGAIDIVSRYKLAVLLPDISDESASLALQYFLKWFPFKVKYIQTDNGLEFQRTFQEFCEKKKIQHYFIHKNSPNENAVIERSFRTDQDEFYYWLEKQPEHIGELNQWLQKFIHEYNTWRPHQSLDYKTPEEIVKMYHMS